MFERELVEKLIHGFQLMTKKEMSSNQRFVDHLYRFVKLDEKTAQFYDESLRLINIESPRDITFNQIENKILYVFDKILSSEPSKKSNLQPLAYDKIQSSLKKAALGIPTSFFSEEAIINFKNKMPPHVYEIMFQIFQIASIYLRLKGFDQFTSETHSNFYEIVKKELRAYENCVVSIDDTKSILEFNLRMYKPFLRLKLVHQINECFKTGSKNPFKYLEIFLMTSNDCLFMDQNIFLKKIEARNLQFEKKMKEKNEYKIHNTFYNAQDSFKSKFLQYYLNPHGFLCDNQGFVETDHAFYCRNQITAKNSSSYLYNTTIFDFQFSIYCNMLNCSVQTKYSSYTPLFLDILKTCSSHINDMTCQFINNGCFYDENCEFFIKYEQKENEWDSYSLDYGLVPFFISFKDAEDILYIGKCVYILNKEEFIDLNLICNVFSNDLAYFLSNTKKMVNEYIKNYLFYAKKLNSNFLQLKDVFLCQRGDFLSLVVILIKEYTNTQRHKNFINRSLSHVLDFAVNSIFKNVTDILGQLDVCVSENEHDFMGIYCHLEHPLNMIFTKEITLKLVIVFRFFWRLKKLEYLLTQIQRRLKIKQRECFIYQMSIKFPSIKPKIIRKSFEDLNKTVEMTIDQAEYTQINSVDSECVLDSNNIEERFSELCNHGTKINKYIILVHQICSYSHTQVINERLWAIYSQFDYVIPEMVDFLNKSLDYIIEKLFRVKKKGKSEMDLLLSNLEAFCYEAGKNGSYNDSLVRTSIESLSIFCEKSYDSIGFIDLKEYI